LHIELGFSQSPLHATVIVISPSKIISCLMFIFVSRLAPNVCVCASGAGQI
jgi:hypothetical protein